MFAPPPRLFQALKGSVVNLTVFALLATSVGCGDSQENPAESKFVTEQLSTWMAAESETHRSVLFKVKNDAHWARQPAESHNDYLSRVTSSANSLRGDVDELFDAFCGNDPNFAETGPFVACKTDRDGAKSILRKSEEPRIRLIGTLPGDGTALETQSNQSCPSNCSLSSWSIDEQSQDLGVDQVAPGTNYADSVRVGVLETGFSAAVNNPYWTMSYSESVPQSSAERKYRSVYCDGTPCGDLPAYDALGGTGHLTTTGANIGSEDVDAGTKHFAANAHLYVGNKSFPRPNGTKLVRVSFGELLNEFDYLVSDSNVRVINMSFGNDSGGWNQAFEYLFDWYVRKGDLILTQSSGNINPNPENPEPLGRRICNVENGLEYYRNNTSTLCQARNAICVGSYHGFDSRIGHDQGPNYANDEVSLFTAVQNPANSDREEPDLLAYGEEHKSPIGQSSDCAPYCSNKSPTRGTSFASPSIAGLAAVTLANTPDWRRCRISEWFRALVQASAIDHGRFATRACLDGQIDSNVGVTRRLARHDLSFNASVPGEDEYQGAGVPNATRMTGWYCPSGGDDPFKTPDDDESFDGFDPEPLDRDNPNTEQQESESQTDQGFTYVSDSNGLVGNAPGQGQPSPPGQEGVELRRFVFTWSTCPDQEEPRRSNSGPGLATDFNLSLETPSGDTFWRSTSFKDNEEMFEFCATEDGPYKIRVVPARQDWGCPRGDGKKGEWMFAVEQRTRVEPDACPELQDYGRGF